MASLDNRRFWLGAFLPASLCALAITEPRAQGSTPSMPDETQQTEAGVLAVDHHWSLAELMGDKAWLDQMLLPKYRSVSSDGHAHSKAAIIAAAVKRAGTPLATATREFTNYGKIHPYGTTVVIYGNTAIVSFYDPVLGPQNGVWLSNVYLYFGGRWHAMYSQHTSVRA